MAKKEIEFYDIKNRIKFKSNNYRIVIKGSKRYAISKDPTGKRFCWRAIKLDKKIVSTFY